MDPRDTRVWQAPDLSAELTFPDYRTGRDPAMKKRSRRRDRKCSPKSRTSFLGHPSAMKFLRISQKREFFNSHGLVSSTVENRRHRPSLTLPSSKIFLDGASSHRKRSTFNDPGCKVTVGTNPRWCCSTAWTVDFRTLNHVASARGPRADSDDAASVFGRTGTCGGSAIGVNRGTASTT